MQSAWHHAILIYLALGAVAAAKRYVMFSPFLPSLIYSRLTGPRLLSEGLLTKK